MELLQLKYFLALAESEHVSRTAEELHISQPSLSATIKKLEDELGVPLFQRSGRNIALSDYGRAFRTYAEQAMMNLEIGKNTLVQMRNTSENTLTLGVLSPYVWSDFLEAFRDKHPEIMINSYSMEGDQYIDALISGRIDMYIGGINDRSRMDLRYETLYTDPMVLLVNTGNPLSEISEVDLRSCKDEKFINLDRNTNLQQFISTLYDAAGFTPRTVMEVDYTIRDEMVSMNYGISITTSHSAQKTKFENVKPVNITYPPFRRELGLVWKKDLIFRRTIRLFHDFAAEYYSKG